MASLSNTERSRLYRRNNPEKVRAYMRAWHHEHPEANQKFLKKWLEDPENQKLHLRRGRISRYKIQFGITIEEYDRLLAEQGGVCAICGLPPDEDERLSVDHDHLTGKNRGLLHGGCNRGLGLFKDDPNLLDKAAEYLRRHSNVLS